jgi:hypothetical protein
MAPLGRLEALRGQFFFFGLFNSMSLMCPYTEAALQALHDPQTKA